MNILLLTTHANTGGITSYLLTLSKGLVKAGHKVVVASADGDCVALFQKYGARHAAFDIRVKSELHPKLWCALGPLKQLIHDEKIDVIHAQTRVTQVMGCLLSRQTGVPMVTTCHGFFKPRFFRRVFPCWGQGVIAVSRPVQEHLIKDFKVLPQQVHLIINGIDLSLFPVTDARLRQQAREQWQVKQGPVIGIIARLSDVKGIDVLLQAMPEIIGAFPKVQLMIVGEGPQEAHLKGLSARLNLNAHVRFEKVVNQTSAILPAFDVFVMPSLMEGLGLSVMEAQAAGIPVVVSNVGGLPDLVTQGKTGLLTTPKDIKGLAQGIINMLKDPQAAAHMAQAARTHIETKCTADVMVDRTIKVYEQYSRR